MNLKRRLLLSFFVVIILLASFAVYQSMVYDSLVRANENLALIYEMTEGVQSIKQDQEYYLAVNSRRYLTSIEETLLKLSSQTRYLMQSKLLSKNKDSLQQISDKYLIYKDKLKIFISTNDQFHAIGTEKSKVISSLSKLIQEFPKTQAQNVKYVYSEGLLNAMLLFSQYEETNSELAIEQLNKIIDIANRTDQQNSAFEIKLYTKRLKTLALKSLSQFEAIEQMNLINQTYLFTLNQELSKLSDLLLQIRLSEQSYANRLLIGIQKTYWIMFSFTISLVFILLYRLTTRITNSVRALVQSANGIAAGDYQLEVKLPGKDEFTELADQLNAMNYSLRMSNLSVKTYSNQLEHMVKAKTLELTRANEALEVVNERLEEEKDRYATLALTDVLTGISNRAYFMEALTQKVDEAKRYGKVFSLLLIDLDHFKLVNDNFGHLVGDDVLKQFALLLKRETRTSDIVARYGGEEFVVIFTEANLMNAYSISERIRIAVAADRYEQVGLNLTISGGLVCYHGESEDALLKRVDELLYVAKNLGRNRIVKG